MFRIGDIPYRVRHGKATLRRGKIRDIRMFYHQCVKRLLEIILTPEIKEVKRIGREGRTDRESHRRILDKTIHQDGVPLAERPRENTHRINER